MRIAHKYNLFEELIPYTNGSVGFSWSSSASDPNGHKWTLTLHNGYRPRLIIVEFNRNYGINEYWTFPNDASITWIEKADCLFGASLAALALLAKEVDYSLIGTDIKSTNAFFVRGDILRELGTALPALSEVHPSPWQVHRPCS